ncbi:MAG: hypothetical protein MAG431_02252 [Chloroflexi bacterium]|nr:hypothetical protein [Chloroflexota bacterium]
MNAKTRKFLVLGLLILALLFPQAAQAAGPKDDKVIFGSNFTLYEGETQDGDLVVFGGNVTLERDTTVNGDVVVLGGRVSVDGTVNGDLVALGGYLDVKSQANINGELTALGGGLERSEEAQINGNIVTSGDVPFEFDFPTDWRIPDNTNRLFSFWHAPLAAGFWFLFRLLIWTGVAILVTLFFQEQSEVVSKVALQAPVSSVGVGLLIVILTPVALLALIITILLSPLSLIAVLILFVAWVLGLTAISLEVGKRLMKATSQAWSPALYAGLGMFILFLILNGFKEVVPCVGWMPKFFVGMWMLGAVALTRFGTQHYPKSDPSPQDVAVEALPEPFEEPAPEEETLPVEPEENGE